MVFDRWQHIKEKTMISPIGSPASFFTYAQTDAVARNGSTVPADDTAVRAAADAEKTTAIGPNECKT